MINFIKTNFLNDKSKDHPAQEIIFHLTVIGVITFFAYFNSLQNGFVIDDTSFILKWDLTRQAGNLPQLLSGAAPAGHEGVYRPLRSVLYLVAYTLWGTNPIFYHALGIIIHLFATALVYLITLRIFGKKSIAFLTGLIFGLHPLHTENVNYIAAVFDNFGALLLLVAFYGYLKNNKRWLIVSVICAILAYFSYEVTLVLPLLLISYEILLKKRPIVKNRPLWALYFAPVFLYAFIRVFVLQITHRGEYILGSFYLTMLTMSKVIFKWLALLVWPANLSINPQIPPDIESWINAYTNLEPLRRQTIFDPPVLLSILVILGLVTTSIATGRRYPIISFCISWFFISLLPVSYIIPQGFLMAERNGYLASFGPILLFAYGFIALYGHFSTNVSKSKYLQNLLILGLIVVVTLFSIRTFIRNRDWQNELTIWHSLTNQQTGTILGYIYQGHIYTNNKQYQKAIDFYQQALKQQPNNIDVLLYLAMAYAGDGQYNQAKSFYQQALDLKPSSKYQEFLAEVQAALGGTPLGSQPEKTNPDETLVKYQAKQGFSFDYPKDWQVKATDAGLTLSHNQFSSQVEVTVKDDTVSFENYLNSQKSNYGKLINQGVMQLPNTNLVYVRLWEEQGIQKLQMTIFKADKIYEVMATPAGTPDLKQLTDILGTLKND